MKRIFISITLFTYLQVLLPQGSFNTGSAELDADLYMINTNAKKDLATFKSDLSNGFGIEVTTMENMMGLGMEPAEVYLSLEIASASRSSINNVVTSYRLNKGKGWGLVAKEMGIWPDSNEFIALKNKCRSQKDKTYGSGSK